MDSNNHKKNQLDLEKDDVSYQVIWVLWLDPPGLWMTSDIYIVILSSSFWGSLGNSHN